MTEATWCGSNLDVSPLVYIKRHGPILALTASFPLADKTVLCVCTLPPPKGDDNECVCSIGDLHGENAQNRQPRLRVQRHPDRSFGLCPLRPSSRKSSLYHTRSPGYILLVHRSLTGGQIRCFTRSFYDSLSFRPLQPRIFALVR